MIIGRETVAPGQTHPAPLLATIEALQGVCSRGTKTEDILWRRSKVRTGEMWRCKPRRAFASWSRKGERKPPCLWKNCAPVSRNERNRARQKLTNGWTRSSIAYFLIGTLSLRSNPLEQLKQLERLSLRINDLNGAKLLTAWTIWTPYLHIWNDWNYWNDWNCPFECSDWIVDRPPGRRRVFLTSSRWPLYWP